MPTYKNISTNWITIGTTQFPPLEEKQVDFYVNNSQLKLISESPIYSPIAYSSQLSGELMIQEHLEPSVNLIKITTTSNAIVSFNGLDENKAVVTSTCPLLLRPVDKFKSIKLHSGSAYVELWKEFTWRNELTNVR